MTNDFVDVHLPGESWHRRGRLLAETQPHETLPLLQIYDSFEYLLALKRHRDGRIDHAEVWRSDDPATASACR